MFDRLRRLWSRSSASRAPLELVLYGKSDCPLCDEMKHALERERAGGGFELRQVDIGGSAELQALYGRSVPVLIIDGRVAFKGRLEPAALRAKLARARGERASGAQAAAAATERPPCP